MARKAARRAAIYARVSTTNGQTPENQLRELRTVAKRSGWVITKEYVDEGISGAKGRDKRPAFNALCEAATRREIDVVMAWSVDRLGRSLTDLVGFLGDVHAKGIDLYLHRQGVDTTTPGGKALFQMLGVFAEFEREMIRERVNAGLARAREKGTKSGRPIGRPATARGKADRVKALRAKGLSAQAIADKLKIGKASVVRMMQKDAV